MQVEIQVLKTDLITNKLGVSSAWKIIYDIYHGVQSTGTISSELGISN